MAGAARVAAGAPADAAAIGATEEEDGAQEEVRSEEDDEKNDGVMKVAAAVVAAPVGSRREPAAPEPADEGAASCALRPEPTRRTLLRGRWRSAAHRCEHRLARRRPTD